MPKSEKLFIFANELLKKWSQIPSLSCILKQSLSYCIKSQYIVADFAVFVQINLENSFKTCKCQKKVVSLRKRRRVMRSKSMLSMK